MIKAVAIDDEPIAIKVIENFCNSLDFIELDKTFNNPKEGLKYLNKFPADLLFLDIDMPFMNGIDLYKQLKQDTMVIFITARADYAVEGFNLSAVDYLVKPFTFDRFQQAVKKATDLLNFQKQNTNTVDTKNLFIRADFSLIKIVISDILYIEGLDDYLKIHIQNQKPLVARMTMKAMLEKLPAKDFVRIHRSFIISVDKVERIKTKAIVVAGKELPIGQSYEAEALKKLGHG
jgi:DNA-binding LytR/AlgR family response regulator